MDQVEEVKQKIDIVSIIGEHVQLKKAGRNFKGLCPFHQEKTPSFMVSPELQIFKCFGCGESGDVFSFLEKYEGMEFGEALKYLSERSGVKLLPSQYKGQSEKEKYYAINELAANFYHYLLLKHSLGKPALAYLKSQRGVTAKAIETFKLGAAPDLPDSLFKFLTKKKFDKRDLEKAGVVVYARGMHIDRFRGRVIYPLYDHRGNAVGLAGRILPEFESRDTGKYINSPETEVYHKGSMLYGLNITRGDIKRHKTAIVVEGEMDLISSWAAGVKNVVAIKGTALTEEQTRLLSRIAERVIIALDSDFAGDAAALRGVFMATDAGLTVKVARFGKYKDPDEAVRQSPEFFKKSLINAQGVWDFVIESIFAKHTLTGDGKARISKGIIPILSGISNKIVQSHYARVVARKLGVDVESVFEEINKNKDKNTVGGQVVDIKTSKEEKPRKVLLEERLLSLAFALGPKEIFEKDLYTEVDFSPYTARVLEKFRELVDNMGKRKSFSLKDFADSLPPELGDRFAQIMLLEQTTEEEKLRQELELVERELLLVNLKESLNRLSADISQLEEAGSKTKLESAKREFKRISVKISELEQQ